MAPGPLPFILAAVSLAPTALLAFEGGDVAVGVVSTLMVALNLAALRIAERRPIQVLVNLGVGRMAQGRSRAGEPDQG